MSKTFGYPDGTTKGLPPAAVGREYLLDEFDPLLPHLAESARFIGKALRKLAPVVKRIVGPHIPDFSYHQIDFDELSDGQLRIYGVHFSRGEEDTYEHTLPLECLSWPVPRIEGYLMAERDKKINDAALALERGRAAELAAQDRKALLQRNDLLQRFPLSAFPAPEES